MKQPEVLRRGDASAASVEIVRPEPEQGMALTLAVLFLIACCALGVARTYSRFGALQYNTNAILGAQERGMEVRLGPIGLNGPRMQLVFHPWHPRPEDMPDEFIFDWRLETFLGDHLRASGTVGFDGERYRRDPEHPPLAFVPLDGVEGEFWLTVSPRGVGDFPDIEVYVTRVAPQREIGLILAWVFGSTFLALLAVAVRRHRLAVAAYERLRRLPAAAVAPAVSSASQVIGSGAEEPPKLP